MVLILTIAVCILAAVCVYLWSEVSALNDAVFPPFGDE